MRTLDNALNTSWNFIKRIMVCSWKDHDYCKPYCFRCWKYFPYKLWEEEA
jgi:hypothetical protein